MVNRNISCDICCEVMRSDNLKLHLQRNKNNCGVKTNRNILPKGGGQTLKNKWLIGWEIVEMVRELKIPNEYLGKGRMEAMELFENHMGKEEIPSVQPHLVFFDDFSYVFS